MGSKNLSPTLLNPGLGQAGPTGLAHIDGSRWMEGNFHSQYFEGILGPFPIIIRGHKKYI